MARIVRPICRQHLYPQYPPGSASGTAGGSSSGSGATGIFWRGAQGSSGSAQEARWSSIDLDPALQPGPEALQRGDHLVAEDSKSRRASQVRMHDHPDVRRWLGLRSTPQLRLRQEAGQDREAQTRLPVLDVAAPGDALGGHSSPLGYQTTASTEKDCSRTTAPSRSMVSTVSPGNSVSSTASMDF